MKKNKEDSFINTKESSISMSLYYKDIRKYKQVSGDEQVELAVRASNGDKLAEKKLVETNQRFIVKIAREYLSMAKGLELEDLISEGNIGLIKAVKKFDRKFGVGFLSYAVWWIRQSILENVYNSNLVRLPANKINLITKLNKIREHFNNEHNREPSVEECCYSDDSLSATEVRDIYDGSMSISLDGFSNDDNESDSCSLIDFIQNSEFNDMEEQYHQTSLSSEISETFKNSLTERESNILNMYFGLNGFEQKTLKEIGKKLKLTNERVRQIKSAALKKLRGFDNILKFNEFNVEG